MAVIDIEFKKICENILKKGTESNNIKRGVKRLQIPSYTFKHSFNDGFPALSLKELKYKSVITELIWFLRGDNNIEYLNKNGVKIWNSDAYNWHVKNGGNLSFKEFSKNGVGSVGQNYSVQWRGYNGKTDQINNLINGMKKDIMSSRLIVNAWNPSELNETALPPCHTFFQIIGVALQDGSFGFELHWHQRSVDVFLGLPFNIASYASLAKILEKKTGYKALAIQGDLKSVHFYDNSYKEAKELISRDANKHDNCELSINSNLLDLDFKDFDLNDFKLKNYNSYDPIYVKMLAPNSI